MDADTFTLWKLFQLPVRYIVPPFQRQYVWTQEKQWEPLWDDVTSTAERYLVECAAHPGNDGAAIESTAAHFLGAIVIQQQQFGAGEIPPWLVIDGQQRMTTLILLLDAAQEVFEGLDFESAKTLSLLLLNPEPMLKHEDHIFKVWPTEADEEAFRHAMHNDLSTVSHRNLPITDAHRYFYVQIEEWLKRKDIPPEDLARALEVAITRLLNVVVIELDPDEEPHVIFETLNARGTPLLHSDLVKSFIHHEAAEQGYDANALHKEHLHHISDSWWRYETQSGRLVRPRVDVFLNYWLVMRRASDVKANDVFSNFRKYAAERPESIAEIAEDIGSVARIYRAINDAQATDITSQSALGRFLYRWHVMRQGVLTPLLLHLLDLHQSGQLEKARLDRCLRILDSYLTRRMVCGMGTRSYYDLFLDAMKRLADDAREDPADDTMQEFLGSETSWARLWPSDAAVEDAFVTRPSYQRLTQGRLRLVLEGIEEGLRSSMTEDVQVPRNLTIEHVMPQRWRGHDWPLPATDDTEEAAEQRDQLIHSIGNLTLANQKLNSKASNVAWAWKSEALADHSILHLNKDLLAKAGDEWDEAAIEERARRLAKVAAEVWPHGDHI